MSDTPSSPDVPVTPASSHDAEALARTSQGKLELEAEAEMDALTLEADQELAAGERAVEPLAAAPTVAPHPDALDASPESVAQLEHKLEHLISLDAGADAAGLAAGPAADGAAGGVAGAEGAAAGGVAAAEGAAAGTDAGAASLLELAEGQNVMALSDEELKRFAQREYNHDGFRLERVDVYNWGSFNNNVKSVYFGGQNVLMTGDNGAGKSSIIDAITVLLYDVKKVVFNQAAGAEKGERNLASYVLGLYKNDNSSGIKTELGLRSKDKAVLSIIMASFYNRKLNEYVVLVQCMVMMKPKTAPNRYYFIAKRDFNLQHDVLPVKDIRELGQKLRKLGCERYDQFADYYRQMQRLFGIEGTKVLDLFYKTISMKSISNISDFVRKQMLEDFNGEELVESLIDRFNDLDASYKSVEEARQQVLALEPICTKGEEYKTVQSRIDFLTRCQDGAGPYLYQKKSELLKVELDENLARKEHVEHESESLKNKMEEINTQILSTRDELVAHGGNRRDLLLQSIRSAQKEREQLYTVYTQYSRFLSNINIEPVENAGDFTRVLNKLVKLQEQYRSSQEHYDDDIAKRNVELRTETAKLNDISSELESLSRRKSNIPSRHIFVRADLCASIGCKESDLPFVGELLQVKAEEKAVWESAIEKVLHGFGLSLLVPEEYYRDVVNYVHTHNLGMRLVFYRIKESDFDGSMGSMGMAMSSQLGSFNRPVLGSNSLPRKLEIKQDKVFYPYLKQRLERQFNFVCTNDQAEYRQEKYALMPSGLCKRGGQNEKDDRASNSGRDYILGWTNAEKISLLHQEQSKQRLKIAQIEEGIKTLKLSRSQANNNLSIIDRLLDFKSYSAIDYRSKDEEIAKLNAEFEELKRSDNIFEALNKRLEQLEQDHKLYRQRCDNYLSELGQLKGRIEAIRSDYELNIQLSQAVQYMAPEVITAIAGLAEQAQKILHFEVLTADKVSRVIDEVTTRLRQEIMRLKEQESNLSQELVNMQSTFTQTFVVAARNLDPSHAAAWEDFKTFLDKLKQDDLPRFVSAFKEKLNRETIEQLGSLNAALLAQSRKIKERIGDINVIMREVDFNPDHYIQMLATESPDLEIKQFRQDLRACTSNMLDSDWSLEEADRKFHEVKALIDRFKGEVNGADIDGRWRRKVIDVKQWYDFSASEHSRQDDSQVDYYEDSGGKSGGQKEKLAYTVLASSLAYQYRSKSKALSDEGAAAEATLTAAGSSVPRFAFADRSYRFVIIDEAFGRGSPQSVDYALTLFSRFNLQLLVATPMQKLDIIEKYVNHVAFVYRDEASHESTVVNYDLVDYILKRKLKEQIAKNALGAHGGLSTQQAGELISKLDERIYSEQGKFAGPVVGVNATEGSLGVDEGESEAKPKRGRKAKAQQQAELQAEKQAELQAEMQAELSTEASAEDAASVAAESAAARARDEGDLFLTGLKDESGNYYSAEDYIKKQQEERRALQQQRTDEALSKLDFLGEFFGGGEPQDQVITAPEQAGADQSHGASVALTEVAPEIEAALRAEQAEVKPKKKAKEPEPHYQHSLEDLLIIDEDDE